jgi:hypothetical protein
VTKHQDPLDMTDKPGTEIATLPPAQRALVVLKSTATEEALKALILRTSVITAPPVDKAGREEVHRAAMDHKNARLTIEKAAKAATEDAKEFTKSVSAEQKRLIALNAEEEARLFKLRDDYDTAEAARKAEEERKERERIAAIKEKIEKIAAIPMQSVADSAQQLGETLDDLNAFEVTFEDFAEFQEDAKAVVTTAIVALSEMHKHAVAREAAEAAAREAEAKLAAQRAEIERQQRELEEQRAALEREKAVLEARTSGITNELRGDLAPIGAATRAEALADDPMSEPERQRHIAGHAEAAQYDANDPGNWRDGEPGPGTSKPIPEGVKPFEPVNHFGNYYAPDGRFMNADGSRNIFDDVDEGDTPVARIIVVPEEHVETAIAQGAAQPGDIVQTPADYSPAFVGVDLAAGPDTAMITVPLSEYEDLKTRVHWLECLEEAGVDNWDGIDEALRILREGDDE